MAPHQRLLHAALGIARDVASKSNVAAGGSGHLRERLAARSVGFAAGRHTACASFHGKDGRAGAWAAPPTATDVLAGQPMLPASPTPSVPLASSPVIRMRLLAALFGCYDAAAYHLHDYMSSMPSRANSCGAWSCRCE